MAQKTEKLFELAKKNLDNKNHDHALRLLNEVLNREPSHPKALRNKGLIKMLQADPRDAEKFLLFAIDQQPEDDQLYQLLGTLYHNNEKPQKALVQYRKALKLNNENDLSHQGIAMVYANLLGEHEKALPHFTKALEKNSENADLYFNRGCSYMITHDMKNAEEDLDKAAKLDHKKAKELLDKYFN